MGSGDLAANTAPFSRQDISGVQVVYNWKRLSRPGNHHDFSRSNRISRWQSACTESCSSRSRDRFSRTSTATCLAICSKSRVTAAAFAPQTNQDAENQPNGAGWVAMQWNPAVRQRFQRC